ncbi:hypothetical protein HMPREF9069_01648 [Atopobium sp. oral taxon 810 str. F0209]|nr:hypothetical protein HMPREF9069_01648 [Atopobium sp. oral taxon 810 str. F0209]
MRAREAFVPLRARALRRVSYAVVFVKEDKPCSSIKSTWQ